MTSVPTAGRDRDMEIAIVLFTRDLRVHDHPALVQAASRARTVIPLFVVDQVMFSNGFATPNRRAFLVDSLADLRASLQARGADLVIRHGDPADETARIAAQTGATAVFASADVSAYAHRREDRLRAAAARRFDLHLAEGVTVVPPGAVLPAGGDHYRVFTPYLRAWEAAARRVPLAPPRRLKLATGLATGTIPERTTPAGYTSPDLPTGGEAAGRRQWQGWRDRFLAGYDQGHDDLAGDVTSRLSPYLHFGCVSAAEVAADARDRPGGGPFTRQLAWRDFFHQVTAAVPTYPTTDYRPRTRHWRTAPDDLDRWKAGRTGVPIVDAGMRQLEAQGWMHNRARMVTASYLVHNLEIDWRLGAAHFLEWLVDGDIANNSGNWQWVAGTGNNPRPNRVLSPTRQAERFDRGGHYVARFVGGERPSGR